MLIQLSCSKSGNKSRSSETKDIRAAVYLSAGDNYPLFNELDIPTFFNLGKIITDSKRDLNTIILSERKTKGSKMNIKPIALFSFEQDTVLFQYIVSINADNTVNKIGSNYNDFLINNHKTQSNIENWFSSQCPESSCKTFKWENTYKALLEINQTEN